jgi:Protein of unknown function (DUF1592)/Protein of unknown function (DUF1588)/Protein of unknown function (DUF1595)/Protein of unknown function (DUF1585)
LLFAGLAACQGNVGGSTGSAGSNGNVAGAAGSSGLAGSIGVGGAGGGLVVSPCGPGIPASSQIPRLTKVQYATVINELLGVTPGADVMDLIGADSAGSLTQISWDGYLTAAEKIATQALGNATSKAKFITCDAAQATCLSDTIKAFGKRAFRRPVTDTEVTSFMRFNSLTPAHTAADVTEAILEAFLASPTFIMVPELAETPEGSAYKLNHYEVAAKLSLLLWNSIPDAALTAAADGGQLGTADQIAEQAKRMLADPKASGVAITFHRTYADVSNGSHWVNVTEHDTTLFPSFKPGSYNAAMQELDAYFAEMVKSGGTFKDLFTSTTAFVTADTAGIYGLNAASFGATPTKTALDATKRPGFLTRIAFLSTFSHFDSTSPILRGAFITGRVLNVPTGTPNPAFLGMKPPPADYKTNREATEALTSPATCAGCHAQKVNPPGFVLERYSAVGDWQDTDPLGGPINSTADITFDGTNFKSISAPVDLMTGIAASPSAQRFYAGMWVNFAAGRPSTMNDACVVDQLAMNLTTNPTYSIASMMADFAKSDSFRLRTVGN